MPSIFETYANVCGIAIPKEPADFPANFFPLPSGRYITIHNGSGADSKNYGYYNEVLELIGPRLKAEGIIPIQIGLPDEPQLRGALPYHLKGLTLRQTAYLIKNAAAHVGNDSCHVHFAGSFKTPIVALYGPTLPSASRPFFHGDIVALESHRDGNHPMFANSEYPKTINFIRPEEVAAGIAHILAISYKQEIQTVNIGSEYYLQQIDYVPDHPLRLKTGAAKILIRLDVCRDIRNAMDCLFRVPEAAGVVTDFPVPEIFQLKHKIGHIVYFLRKDYSKDFVDQIQRSGIPYTLISKKEVPLNDLKLDLLDYQCPEEEQTTDKPKWEDCFFKTKRFVLAQGEIYPTLAHFRRGIRHQAGRPDKTFFSDPEFQQFSANHYYFNIL